MRWVICAGLLFAFAPNAFAGDFDVLRGTQPTYNWSGFYFGGQVGYSSADYNFGSAANSNVAFILRNTLINQDEGISKWKVLQSTRSAGSDDIGGFVGYNSQWQDIVLGLEANYNRVSIAASSSGFEERTFFDSNSLPANHNYFYDVKVSAQAQLQMTDLAEFRARAGVAVSNYLPYAFVGFAVGRASYSNVATVEYTAVDYPAVTTPPTAPLADLSFGPVSQGQAQNNTYVYGLSTGGGVDIGLGPNLFLRGELEYIYFAPIDGIHVSVASARVGAALKF
ncbi:MAG TPA: hypothetical protein VMC05_02570 [Xanthobacteraceae bacterium]|nr:hypothetical protein [Xanthobacteraceae bacterium]